MKSSARVKSFFFSTVKKRAPVAKNVQLKQKTVYIIPSRFSFAFLLLIVLLLISAVNYDNNLLYIVCFWLFVLLIWNFILTFRNLSGLRFSAHSAKDNFVGQPLSFVVELHSVRPRLALDIQMQSVSKQINLLDKQPYRLTLFAHSDQRGKYELPVIKVSSQFPFFTAFSWSYVFLDLHAWAYPLPIASDVSIGVDNALNNEQDHQILKGNEDFYALEEYQPGQAMHRVHWPSLAKRDLLQSKQFVDYQQTDLWLVWQNYPSLPAEQRLQHFSFLIEQYSQAGLAFGLEMPAKTLQQNVGQEHRQQCLLLLAQYGFDYE